MSICVTFNRGHVAVGSQLSITNGACREVRAMILEREAKDTARRKAMPRKQRRTFTEFKPQGHLTREPDYNERSHRGCIE